MAKTKTLGDKFKSTALIEVENIELKKEVKTLRETVSKLLTADMSIVTKLTPEQEIVEVQIHLLNLDSRSRPLTLDETKKLDLLIRNKRLLTVKSKDDSIDVTDSIPEEALLEIAGNVEEIKPKKAKRSKS